MRTEPDARPESRGNHFMPRIGEVLGSYELVRTLGEGGMAVVYEGRHKLTGERAAVKILAPELTQSPEIVARFDREARAVQKLRTRHVAHVLEVASTEWGIPFIVMEFLEGRDLGAELAMRAKLPLPEAVDYVLQACAAMDEVHRAGVVHRDLKPANLFVVRDGQTSVVKVIDFGISKLLGDVTKLTGSNAVLGTVIYMSPEQLKASTEVDPRSDIWSLGIILFELLAGRAPFEGTPQMVAVHIASKDPPDVRTFASDVPEVVAAVIATMLQRSPDRRFQSCREVALALAPFADPSSVGASLIPLLTSAPAEAPSVRPPSAGRTLPLSQLQKHTLPLVNRPGRPTPLPSRTLPLANPGKPNPRAAPTIQIRRSGTTFGPMIAGALLGVLTALLVVLVVFALRRKDDRTPTIPSAAVSTSTQPPSNRSAAPESSSPPPGHPSAAAPASAARPPPPPPRSSAPRSSAPANPTPTAPTPSTNPQLL